MSLRLRMAHVASLAAAMALGACATFAPDAGFDRVRDLTKERTGQSAAWQRNAADAEAVRSRVGELLNSSLTADGAVEVALLNNPRLQARFQELRIAEADLVAAGRLVNPTFRFEKVSGGGITEIERAVLVNVLAIVTMPLRSEFASRRFEETRLEIAGDAVSVAAEARRAFFAAVAAQELVKYFEQVKATAEASNELARRMVQAGNFSKLAQMREQAFYADATAQLARAQHQSSAELERLTRALGLPSSDALRLPERLPDLPAAPVEPGDAERVAIDKRLDVLAAKSATQATARSLELTKVTGVVNVLEAGYRNKSVTHEQRQSGYEIELQLPIFDFGATRRAQAEATYMQAVQRTAGIAINARSEVRESYSAYRTTYDLARHYRDEVVPLRKRISDENLLRYNGMLISIFELLADSREHVASVTAAIEALRDFWLADTDLQMALTGPGAAGVRAAQPTAASTGVSSTGRH